MWNVKFVGWSAFTAGVIVGMLVISAILTHVL